MLSTHFLYASMPRRHVSKQISSSLSPPTAPRQQIERNVTSLGLSSPLLGKTNQLKTTTLSRVYFYNHLVAPSLLALRENGITDYSITLSVLGSDLLCFTHLGAGCLSPFTTLYSTEHCAAKRKQPRGTNNHPVLSTCVCLRAVCIVC
jgi:hypothetical protein